ncbi:hypothetical protein O181_078768 [Austropuccinia psidii MF-1]|uniref:Uncharacterized protein n=1 Tax=Austropuccinia psidii MF-1 TaxID=1389203 RepID=A0A9Q3FJL0_9BASI|nr:hypothetical protein [Austropuccinia psidii MF-1]
MVRQERIETASTVTSIIPASTVNYEHNITVILTQNNQPEPIYSELINFEINNTLQKAKNLANNHERAINPQETPQKGYRCDYCSRKSVTEGQGSVNESQTDKLCHSEADNTVLPSKRADTTTRSLSGHIQSHTEGLKQFIAAQRVLDPCRSVEKLHEFLPDCEKSFGPSQHLQVTQWMESIDGKEKHDAFNSRIKGKKTQRHPRSFQKQPQ